MLQDILTWTIIAICVLLAVRIPVRRFRSKGRACDCGCGGNSKTEESCKPSSDGCSGCAIADLCNNPKKK